MSVTVQDIARLIQTSRFPLTDEKQLQTHLALALEEASIPYRREVRLGPGDIIDFMVDEISLGMELKIKGNKRAIYKQIERYCQYPEVKQIMLVTNVAMGMPKDIGGVTVYFVSLARGWL